MWRVILGLLIAVASLGTALACRCPEQPLGTYFANAELVFLGRVLSIDTLTDPANPRRAVRFAVQGKPYKGDPKPMRELATPLSSATCGYAVEPDRLYVIFASRHAAGEDVSWFDTCNGSRAFDPKSSEGVRGFTDVAAAEVLARLARLRAGEDPRTAATPRLPIPGDPAARVIGLLELPSLLSDTASPTTPIAAIALYAEPAVDAARVEPLRRREDVITREYAYEIAGAVVEARRPGWFRLTLPKGRAAWIREADAGPFHSMRELLVGRLTYLGTAWDGWVWPAPGAGYPTRAARRAAGDEQPVNIVGTEDIGGSLWLQIELLDRSPCEGEEPNRTHNGWVPGYTAAGEPVAWFYSRGC